MNRNLNFGFKASLIISAMLALTMAQAQTMAKNDYQANKARISEAYKADRATCAALSANAKDICIEEAKAKEKIARAELEYAYTGKPRDQAKVLETKAKSAYAVAKEKCDDKAGNEKDVCVKEAKAVQTKALEDAKANKQISEAKKDAASEKREADYKVAAEKCDAMTGDAKNSCIAAAKAQFGKN